MNSLNPEKLHHSKWTAVRPQHKEKHFLVTAVERDEQEQVVAVVLEAVYTGRETSLPWAALKDDATWLMGWR